MRFNVQKKRRKLAENFYYAENFLNDLNNSSELRRLPLKRFVLETGALNHFWQTWNSFWRCFWLAEILGGVDIKGVRIAPYNSTFLEERAVSFLYSVTSTNTTPHYREKSWGDIDNIEKIALNLLAIPSINPKATTISSIVSVMGESVKHLQTVRNCSIHFDHHSQITMRGILTSYAIPNYKYPTDVISARKLSDGKKAIISWKDELTAFLDLI